jgi:hypothetical protein
VTNVVFCTTFRLMKVLDTPEKLFRLSPNQYCEGLNGKTVQFLYDLNGSVVESTGELIVHVNPEFERVDIHTGPLYPFDPPYSYYELHLCQEHVRSLVPAKPGSKVDLVMERPLWSRECVKRTFNDRNQFGGISAAS